MTLHPTHIFSLLCFAMIGGLYYTFYLDFKIKIFVETFWKPRSSWLDWIKPWLSVICLIEIFLKTCIHFISQFYLFRRIPSTAVMPPTISLIPYSVKSLKDCRAVYVNFHFLSLPSSHSDSLLILYNTLPFPSGGLHAVSAGDGQKRRGTWREIQWLSVYGRVTPYCSKCIGDQRENLWLRKPRLRA